MKDLIKQFLADDSLFYTALIVLIGVASFGLGRLSIAPAVVPIEAMPASVLVTQVPRTSDQQLQDTSKSELATSKSYVVASKNGTKYHLPTCPGAKQITEANKITFESTQAARAAGYTPAANCKGLE